MVRLVTEAAGKEKTVGAPRRGARFQHRVKGRATQRVAPTWRK